MSEKFRFTNVSVGDVLVFNYNLKPEYGKLMNVTNATLTNVTGKWLDNDYHRFLVQSISGTVEILLTVSEINLSELTVGSTFRFGRYYVSTENPHAIEWRIVHQTDDYQIAMVTEILDYKCFDAREPNNTATGTANYGNNNWKLSNICQFLNSDQKVWYKAQHEYDTPPSLSYTDKNAYDDHYGFLYYFSDYEKSLLKDMTIKYANPSSGSYEWTGKVWLPTRTQIVGGTNNSIAEGERFTYFTTVNSPGLPLSTECIAFNDYCIENRMIHKRIPMYYSLSSASTSSKYNVYQVSTSRSLQGNAASNYDRAMCPCICLPRS